MLHGIARKLKSFNFLATRAPNSRENKSIYTVQRSAILVYIFVASRKAPFTHADFCVTYPCNGDLSVAKALQVFDMDNFLCPSAE